MKNIIGILFLFIAFAAPAINPKVALDSARAAYTRNDFLKAVDQYEDILNSGLEASQVYFNLGNAYYKSGNMPSAILNYERALRLSPADEDIQFNLQMAQRFVVDKIESLPEFFLTLWMQKIVNIYASNTWAVHSIVAFITSLFLFLFFFLSRSRFLKKITFWFGMIIVGYSISALVFSNAQKNWAENHNEAIIFTPSVTVKSTPDESGTDLFLIHEGLKVTITDKVGDWVEIKLVNGSKGWMMEEGLRKI